MTLILPLLISNGSWGSSLPKCEGSPLSETNRQDTTIKWNNCQGTYNFVSGNQYIGEFKDGLRHGRGTYTNKDGSPGIVGEWKDGYIHGQGTMTYPDGSKYEGEWKDGFMHGQGTFTFSYGRQYVGEYKDSLRHGQGTMTYPDGTKDEGIWKEGTFLYENIAITNEDKEFCQEIGFTINTPEYDNCVQKTAEKD